MEFPRLSKNLQTKGFGGKDRVKENRQACLSRFITRPQAAELQNITTIIILQFWITARQKSLT